MHFHGNAEGNLPIGLLENMKSGGVSWQTKKLAGCDVYVIDQE